MIYFKNNTFKIDTKNTSYIFRILSTGHLEQLFYGERIAHNDDYNALYEKNSKEYGNCVSYSQDNTSISLEHLSLEISGIGRGDFREAGIDITLEDGSYVTDYTYVCHTITKEKQLIKGMPSSYGSSETLEILLEDKTLNSNVKMYYHVFPECDIITRHLCIIANEAPLTITRAMSSMIDFPRNGFVLSTLNGTWADEMVDAKIKLERGIHINDSKTGVSSNRHNPFIMLSDENASENRGDCYAFNLIYSGNHCEIIEVSPFNQTRVLIGLNDFHFAHKLGKGDRFETPEAVLTFSPNGYNGIRKNMHAFVNNHIVREVWKDKERPILVNSWEAYYFDIDEEKLVQQAKISKTLGAELYVVDDGWFGKRNDDKTSLGDWYVNTHKFPNGLAGLSKRLEQIPIGLGIWIEPEMVSVESELYAKHPDWALKVKGRHASMGRNQLVLDLTRSEVRDYIVESIVNVISSANISYVKWDMNRNIAEVYSNEEVHNLDFYHRYTLGLYDIIGRITGEFPEVLFEGCSAGGNRFDLGILCFMPQIWLSDNTDANRRMDLQLNASIAYPVSSMCAHVSACPNHQTGRITKLQTRFDVACSGVLGYELDVSKMNDNDKIEVAKQIEFYKKHRKLLLYGDYQKLEFKGADNCKGWIIVSEDKSNAIVMIYQQTFYANRRSIILKLSGLDGDKKYKFSQCIEDGQEYVASGDLLTKAGIRLNQIIPQGTDNKNISVMGDYSTLMFEVTQVN